MIRLTISATILLNTNIMRQTQLLTKTRREAPADESAKNAQLLIRGGYIHKELAGVYAYLPLGKRVIEKISQIVKEEMNNNMINRYFMSKSFPIRAI